MEFPANLSKASQTIINYGFHSEYDVETRQILDEVTYLISVG
jgi:hypothetical protein